MPGSPPIRYTSNVNTQKPSRRVRRGSTSDLSSGTSDSNSPPTIGNSPPTVVATQSLPTFHDIPPADLLQPGTTQVIHNCYQVNQFPGTMQLNTRLSVILIGKIHVKTLAVGQNPRFYVNFRLTMTESLQHLGRRCETPFHHSLLILFFLCIISPLCESHYTVMQIQQKQFIASLGILLMVISIQLHGVKTAFLAFTSCSRVHNGSSL